MSESTQPVAVPKSGSGKIVLLIVLPLLIVSSVVSGFLSKLGKSPERVPKQQDDDQTLEPIVTTIDRQIRNREYLLAAAACESADVDPEDPRIRYRWAICRELSGSTAQAIGAYERLATRSGGKLGIYSTLGFVRCGLAVGRTADAVAALSRLDELDPFFDSRIGDERARLKTCVLFLGLGAAKEADPMDISAIAWPRVAEGWMDRPIWLPEVTGSPEPPIFVPFDSRHSIATEPNREMSRDMMRQALSAVVETGRVPAASLALANLDRIEGHIRSATERYQRIVLENPDSPEALLASYNLGLGSLTAGSIADAREYFLGVVDRDPEGYWGDLARYWIGRTYLDSGDWTAARRAFHPITGSANRRLRTAAGFGSALARLLEGDNESFTSLVRHLDSDSDAFSIELRNCFEAISRWLSRPTELRAEQLELLLTKVGEFRRFGPAGVLAVGRLWRGMGRADRAAKLWDSVAADFRGPLAVRVVYESAVAWEAQGQLEHARARYNTVAALDGREWGLDAELKLAAMDLTADRATDALTRAYRVWHRRNVASQELLALMGRAYEKLGRYAAAAECYSGFVPKID